MSKKQDPKRNRRRKKNTGSFLVARNTGLARLQERVDACGKFLKGRLDALRMLRQERDRDLASCRQAIVDAETRLSLAQARRLELHREADGLEAEAEQLIEQARICRRCAELVPVELADENLTLDKMTLHERIVEWRDEFRRAQDGRTRRKRSELARLLARLEKRREETKRVAEKKLGAEDILYLGDKVLDDRGTGDPLLGKIVKTIKLKPKQVEEKADEEEKQVGEEGEQEGAAQDSGGLVGEG